MITEYRTIASRVEAELEVSRSRFLTIAEPVADESQARDVIAAVRAEHRSAGHHCTAFVLGADGATTRTNDDGEPSGTAGHPMLTALKGEGVTFTVAVVARWFGGVKLGTGGLSRAYGEAVHLALADATVVSYEMKELLSTPVGFGDASRVEHAMRSRGYHVQEVSYSEAEATVTFSVDQGKREALSADLDAAVAGHAELTHMGWAWQAVS